MSRFVWRSPWPQWRTHWHVWHAWPVLAQVLVLSWCGLCAGSVGSWYWSNEAWQAWWCAEETDAEQQQQQTQLQSQWQQLQATQRQLQAQPHPSGGPWPAWQALPKLDAPTQHARILQLAQQHGLQLQTVNDEGGQWRGPLPHLLAAWQNMAVELPQLRLVSFELSRLDNPAAEGVKQPVAPDAQQQTHVGLQMAWRWTTALEKDPGLRPVALGASAKGLGADDSPSPGAQVLHNLFAPDGLAQALPSAAHQHLNQSALAGHSLKDMQWMGMLSKAGQQEALVMHGGLIHALRVGHAMGQDFGEVVQIAADHVLLREWRLNAQGQWQAETTRFPSAGSP